MCEQAQTTAIDPAPLACLRYHAQNCTTKCAASYGNDKYDAFMGCAMKHHCVSFPKIDTHCTQPTPDPTLALSDMAGEWWQHWGTSQGSAAP